jgi:hypothetical protein
MGVDAHKHYRTPLCALDFCAFLVGMLLDLKQHTKMTVAP